MELEKVAGKTIVVLGSKPDANFPAVEAAYVLGANGAVELASLYRARYGSRVIGLVPGVELLKHEHIQQSFRRGTPDEIIVFGDAGIDIESYIRNDLGLSPGSITVYSIRERHQFMKRVLGWRILPVIMERIKVRGIRHAITKVIPDLLFGGDMDWLSHSTGLDSIMYAMDRFKDIKEIITAGIGLQGGAHFNKVGEFMQKTAIADRGTMKHWPLSLREKVFTTDEAFHTIGGVPMWKGETFKA